MKASSCTVNVDNTMIKIVASANYEEKNGRLVHRYVCVYEMRGYVAFIWAYGGDCDASQDCGLVT